MGLTQLPFNRSHYKNANISMAKTMFTQRTLFSSRPFVYSVSIVCPCNLKFILVAFICRCVQRSWRSSMLRRKVFVLHLRLIIVHVLWFILFYAITIQHYARSNRMYCAFHFGNNKTNKIFGNENQKKLLNVCLCCCFRMFVTFCFVLLSLPFLLFLLQRCLSFILVQKNTWRNQKCVSTFFVCCKLC